MSVSQFGGPTQPIEAGDTPDFDDNQVSRLMAAGTILKGQASVMLSGVVTIATSTNAPGFSPFVPIESKTNTNGTEIRGVTSDQFVALTTDENVTTLDPGDLVQISNTIDGTVEAWDETNNDKRYARYIGKEAGLLTQDGSTPFTVSLSTGVIPDQTISANEVGWFKLLEASA